ncbi:MAG: hypothetical protein AMXMBFR58_04020 [Phycisphaerae bacterium]|nr:hypothetical protein [Phycisphaerales bacterium]MCK6476172.1 hypothetical protein [Phycisphaerales bacterium]
MKKIISLVAFASLAAAAQADILMRFEEIPGDIQAINNFYTGVTFGSSSTGSPLVTRRASTNNYNISSTNGNMYNSGEYWIHEDVGVTSALDNSGNDGKISFDNKDATYVDIQYCSASTFWLEAYDVNGNLLDVDSGPANLRFINSNPAGPGLLSVKWDGTNHIAYVIVHDTGNFWVIDNVRTDASDITPAPGAAALLGMGALFAGRRRR